MSVKLDQALVQAFIDGAFGLGIAHENAAYTPTPGTPYVELRMFHNDELASDLADTNDTTGLLQFILRYPENAGAITAKTMRDTIFDAFPVGGVKTYSGQRLTITGHGRPQAVPEDGTYKVTGQIFFRADVAR